MTTTMTLKTEDIGAAKKHRDAMRKRLRADLEKMSSKYNIPLFEAAHAVIDTVLQNIDSAAVYGGGYGMPNNMAQTLLPYTQALVESTHPTTSKPKVSSIVDDIHVPEHLNSKAKPKSKAKLDKHVTGNDIKATITWSGSGHTIQYKAQQQALKDCADIYGESFWIVTGSGWLSSVNPWGLSSGYTKVVVRIPKNSPYVSEEMYKKLNLTIPKGSGLKWRKLKNKPIYKLQDYSKKSALDTPMKGTIPTPDLTSATPLALGTSKDGHVSWLSLSPSMDKLVALSPLVSKAYPILPAGYIWLKDNSKHCCYVMKAEAGLKVPQSWAMETPAPKGYHWETHLGKPELVILIPTTHTLPDGSPIPTSPKAKFPHDPTDDPYSVNY